MGGLLIAEGLAIGHIMRYIRIGECNRCGECCEAPTKERIEAYHRAGFTCRVQHESGCPFEEYREGKIFCTNYEDRPKMCRDFPTSPVDIETLPNCSYRFTLEREISKWKP